MANTSNAGDSSDARQSSLYDNLVRDIVWRINDAKSKDMVPAGFLTPEEIAVYFGTLGTATMKAVDILANGRDVSRQSWGGTVVRTVAHIYNNDMWPHLKNVDLEPVMKVDLGNEFTKQLEAFVAGFNEIAYKEEPESLDTVPEDYDEEDPYYLVG